MALSPEYVTAAPPRADVDRLPGPVVLEFGTSWCGFCRALDRDLADLLDNYPQVRHLRVEDGKGRPLGRSFRVKLWPTLVFLKDGRVVAQAVRPERAEVERGLRAIADGNGTTAPEETRHEDA